MDARTKYNALVKFERIPGRFRSNRKIYPVHKSLVPVEEEGRKFGQDISEWILRYADMANDAQILDAGCGNGHTLLQMVRHTSRKGIGISISDEEIRTARQNFSLLYPELPVYFINQSYDEPLPGKYDAIVAVESLKHSANLGKSLENLSAHLKPGGSFIIIEDLFALLPDRDKNLELLKNEWALSHLYQLNDYTSFFREKNFLLQENIDLTRGVRFRNSGKLKKLISRYRAVKPWVMLSQWKKVLNIFLAGFIYEDYYAQGLLEYRMLKFVKKA